MSTINSGSHLITGNIGTYHDHGAVYNLIRPDGDQLAVAVVADGGMGTKQGHLAANTAVETLLTHLQKSTVKNIHTLLEEAVQSTNSAVHELAEIHEGTRCSLAVAVIHNQNRLYVAQVGTCRIYFVRDSKITQVSLDHTADRLALIQSDQNKDSAGYAAALGLHESIQVDTGYHIDSATGLNRDTFEKAQYRGQNGLPLHNKDSIFLSTDGIIGTNGPLIQDDEIVQVLNAQSGNRAARGLVSFALGREIEDNLAIALLQKQPKSVIMPRPKAASAPVSFMIGALIALMLVLCGAGVWFFQDPENTAQAEAAHAQTDLEDNENTEDNSELINIKDDDFSVYATQTVAAIIAATETARPTATPSPTATPRPTLAPGQIGVYRFKNQDEFKPVNEDDTIFSSQISEIQINHEGIEAEDMSFYGIQGSEVEFNEVDDQVEVRTFEESDFFIETGFYKAGVEVEVRAEDGDLKLTAENACVAVRFSPEEENLEAFCFRGTCHYQINRDKEIKLDAGQQLIIDPADFSKEILVRPIPRINGIFYDTLLSNFQSGRVDANKCLGSYLPPTATPSPPPPYLSLHRHQHVNPKPTMVEEAAVAVLGLQASLRQPIFPQLQPEWS